MYDMHIHTKYSSDSDEEFSAYISQAQMMGVKAMCFSEHVDNNPEDHGVGYYDSTVFFEEFNKVKAETKDVELLSGIEFDCPHCYQKELADLSCLPYDCIIGSVHYCNLSPNSFFSDLIKNGVTAEDCFAAYWNELLKCVSVGGFDVLGHIDIPKRYFKTLIYDETALREILYTMISNDIILEINTSSLRKGLSDVMPENDILKLYRDEGGKYVTIGSDAHTASELSAGNTTALSLIRSVGLCETVFRKRKMIIV